MKSYIASKRKNLEEFLEKNKTFVLPTVILGGFVIDTLTLGQVDRAFDNFVILFHLFVVGTSIALLFSVDSRLGRKLRLSNYDSTIQTLMLFSLGGLFSGFTVFYAKSGSLISSWPFILIMIAVMLGTEIQKKHFQKVIFQVSLFYVAIFSYLIFSLPVLVRKMGPDIYMLSGVAGLCVMVFYLFVLSKLNKTLFVKYKKPIIIRIISIFFIFNFLYFANIIPPIPLSLKFRAVYHDFSRIQGVEYRGFYEPYSGIEFWRKRDRVFNRFSGEPVFVYTEVYAPVNLGVDIYHRWEYFDPTKTRWVESSSIKIPITGGREGGYRGFSKKSNIWPGSWRVKVTTSRGQTVGEVRFRVKDAEERPELLQEIFK
jgi:hypothetical protein